VKCPQFEQLLDRYLNGELTGSFKLELEAHVVECEGCGHLLAMMQSVGQIIREPADDEPRLGGNFTEKVLSDLAVIDSRRRRWRGLVVASSAAAALIMAVGSLMWFAGPEPGTPVRFERRIAEVGPEARETVILARNEVGSRNLASGNGEGALETDTSAADIKVKGMASGESVIVRRDFDPGSLPDGQGKVGAIAIRPPSPLEMVTGNKDTQLQVQMELQHWLVSTLREATVTIHQLQQAREFVLGQMADALIQSIVGKQPLAEPILPAMYSDDLPVDDVSSDPDVTLS